MPDLLVRLLTRPDLLRALERGDVATLRRCLPAEPVDLAAITTLDAAAVRHYLRRLQRKQLEIVEPIFPASLPAAREHHGADAVAAEFWWWWCRPRATVPAHDVSAAVAAEWTRFAGHVAQRGPLTWLGDLSRYEAMRWRAVSLAAPAPEYDQGEGGAPVLAPGVGLATFAVDVPLLLRTVMAGDPTPSPGTTRLIMWGDPAGGIRTVRLGHGAYQALLLCDGSNTIDRIAAGAGRPGVASIVAASLRDLVRAGALRLSAAREVPAEQQHASPV